MTCARWTSGGIECALFSEALAMVVSEMKYYTHWVAQMMKALLLLKLASMYIVNARTQIHH